MVEGVTYLPTFRKCDHYVGLVIRPNVHINTEGGVHGVGVNCFDDSTVLKVPNSSPTFM